MYAFRKSRLVVLLAFVAVLALGMSVSPAEAGGHKFHVQKFHKVHSIHPHHADYDHYYQPIVKYVVKPYSYPVTLIDCYGQPYVVWKTSYQTVPTYWP